MIITRTYIYIYTYIHIYMCIYIYIERERDSEREREREREILLNTTRGSRPSSSPASLLRLPDYQRAAAPRSLSHARASPCRHRLEMAT